MKTFTINGKDFQLSKEVFTFLEGYHKRIEQYVQKNHIDADLHQDILQRLADKLIEQESKGNLSQKSIIQIVNDLGEPEEIFSDEIEPSEEHDKISEKSDSKVQDSLPFYTRLQNAKRSRPQQWALIRGVCKMLEQVTGWNVWIWRGLFFTQFIFGFSILLPLSFSGYLLCALVFPRKEKEYWQRSLFNYIFKQFFDLILAIPNFFSTIGNIIRSIFAAAWPTTGNFIIRLWKFLLRALRTGFLLFINGILVLGILFLGVVFYFLITGLEYHGMDFSLIFPAITTRGVISGIIFLLLLLSAAVWGLLRKQLLPKFARFLAIGTGAFAGVALFATIWELFQYHGRGSFMHKETLELTQPQNPKDFSIDIHQLPQETWLIFEDADYFIRQNLYLHLYPSFDKTFKAEYTYNIYFAQNKKGKARFQQMIKHLIKPSQKREWNTLHLGYFEPELFNQAVPATVIDYSIDLYVPVEYLFTLLQDWGDRAWFIWGLEMPNWQHSNSKLVCHSKMNYNKEKEKFVCEMKMTYNDQKWLVEQYLRDHADEIVPFKGLNPEWSRRYHSTDPYWNLHSIQWTTDHGLLAKYSDQFFNLFIEIKWDLDQKNQVKLKNIWIKDIEQKGRMNKERIEKYSWWDSLKKFEIKMQDKKQELLTKIQDLQEQLENLE